MKQQTIYGTVACKGCRWVKRGDHGHWCDHPDCYDRKPYRFFDSYTGELREYPRRKEHFETLNAWGKCTRKESMND